MMINWIQFPNSFEENLFSCSHSDPKNDLILPWILERFLTLYPPTFRPDGQKKAYVRLASDYDALDVANKIGII